MSRAIFRRNHIKRTDTLKASSAEIGAPKKSKARRLTYVGQPSRLAPGVPLLKKSKARRLTYVGQPSRLAPEAPLLKKK
jgi:hypothetical protein